MKIKLSKKIREFLFININKLNNISATFYGFYYTDNNKDWGGEFLGSLDMKDKDDLKDRFDGLVNLKTRKITLL